MFEKLKLKEDTYYRGAVPYALRNNNKNSVYICSSSKNLEDYQNTLKDFYEGRVIALDHFYDEDEFIRKNYELKEVLESEEPYILLLSLESLFREYFLSGEVLEFDMGREIKRKEIEEKLFRNGYIHSYLIEKEREFSSRGDILDIYPLNGNNPVRIEFFGDTIERITHFDIETQKSIEELNQISVYINNNNSERKVFLDFFKKFNLSNAYEFFIENLELLNYKFEEILIQYREEEETLRREFQRIKEISKKIEIQGFTQKELKEFENLENIIERSENEKFMIFSEEEKRYRELIGENKNIEVIKYPHFEGFIFDNKTILTDRELKGIKVKRSEDVKEGIRYRDISQIRTGDYIIHENYGVGIYLGIENVNGEDYLAIKYADEDKLFVPVGNLDRIEKYIYDPGTTPEIYHLGRRGFKRKREKLREDMLEYAKEIIAVQAKRELNIGYKFSKDTVWQEEFEEGFPYGETKDQITAIADTKRDMESSRVMDRIVCGDVGYGKTEVAIRATFKAVMDHRQVVILVPTTVLAQQHLERFIERFINYPIIIESLSRLKSDKEQESLLKSMREGSVDIVIGTHRLLSEDIKFKNLGLIIVDEEQKFGVKAKEALKKYRTNVDMLTLTATPIPRTLNLALLGIRDISIINTAPAGRLSIENIFIEKNDRDIREAIMREIGREGQVFYIYNSVRGMERKIKELEKMLPKYVSLSHIHGQMGAKEIKERLRKFENGEIDILLSTTIIENGIDIPNANTIIIEGMKKLGLSQVYQLRGRVGRGKRRGYCYIVSDSTAGKGKKEELREESLKDLGALGSGFQLSLEDMKIRGAGEILGEKQHGAIETFGYNLYLKMLKEEVEKIKGNMYTDNNKEVEIDLNMEAYIPSEYIEEAEKIIIYRRSLRLESIEELSELKDEVRDRFGKMPYEAENFFYFLQIKILAKKADMEKILRKKDSWEIKFNNEKVNMKKIIELMNEGKIKYRDETIIYTGEIENLLDMYLEEEQE